MTPHSRELADRLEKSCGPDKGLDGPLAADIRQAAALLRREPSVEEVAQIVRMACREWESSPVRGGIKARNNAVDRAAQAVAALWGREPG